MNARATSSLPVPLSPVMRTVASLPLASDQRGDLRGSVAVADDRVDGTRGRDGQPKLLDLAAKRLVCDGARDGDLERGERHGLADVVVAPARIALIAVSMLPCDVTTIPSVSDWRSRKRDTSSSPETSLR